jgi:hypothetical protein
MPDVIIFLFCLIAIVGLTTYLIILRKRYKNLIAMYAKSIMDIDVLQNELKMTNYLHASDEFLKFISNSRDAAYTYIEEVQVAIKDFAEKADHIIRTPDVSPNTVLAYKKLIEMLPNEENKDNA